jgi:hypothetical protein
VNLKKLLDDTKDGPGDQPTFKEQIEETHPHLRQFITKTKKVNDD